MSQTKSPGKDGSRTRILSRQRLGSRGKDISKFSASETSRNVLFQVILPQGRIDIFEEPSSLHWEWKRSFLKNWARSRPFSTKSIELQSTQLNEDVWKGKTTFSLADNPSSKSFSQPSLSRPGTLLQRVQRVHSTAAGFLGELLFRSISKIPSSSPPLASPIGSTNLWYRCGEGERSPPRCVCARWWKHSGGRGGREVDRGWKKGLRFLSGRNRESFGLDSLFYLLLFIVFRRWLEKPEGCCPNGENESSPGISSSLLPGHQRESDPCGDERSSCLSLGSRSTLRRGNVLLLHFSPKGMRARLLREGGPHRPKPGWCRRMESVFHR